MHSEITEMAQTNKWNIRSASHICLNYFRNARSARQMVTQRRQKKRVATTLEKVDSCIDKSDRLKREAVRVTAIFAPINVTFNQWRKMIKRQMKKTRSDIKWTPIIDRCKHNHNIFLTTAQKPKIVKDVTIKHHLLHTQIKSDQVVFHEWGVAPATVMPYPFRFTMIK